MTDRKKAETARTGEARLVSVSRYGQPAGPSQLAETFLAGGGAPISDSGAILRWGVRRYAWLVLLCVAVVGVLLPFQELNKKARYTSESLVVAVDLTADLKTLPRLGEAVFDDGTVAQVVSQQFGTAGDAEDVIPKLASVVTEQDSLVMHVQGHSGNGQESADIANAAAAAFVLELNKAGSGVGSFRVLSTAVPPVERDEPLQAAPYSVSTGLAAGLIIGLGVLILLLVLRRPVVEPSGAARATDLPVFGTVTMPRTGGGSPPAPDEARGLAPVCRQLLDWSPSTVIVTGPDTAAQERHHLSRLLGDVFASVRQLPLPGADGMETGEGHQLDDRAISVVDGSSSIDLISPGARSFVVLAVPVGVGVARLRDLARDLTGVPSAIVLVRTRGRRRRRKTSAGAGARRSGGDERHRGHPEPTPATPDAPSVDAPSVDARVLDAPTADAAVASPSSPPRFDELTFDELTTDPTPAAPLDDLPVVPGGDQPVVPPAPVPVEPAGAAPPSSTSAESATSSGSTAASSSASPRATADTDAVLRWVGANVGDWLPALAGPGTGATLRVDEVHDRARCRVYVVTVRGTAGSTTLVVKQRRTEHRLRRRDRFPDRPTLSPEAGVDPGEAARIEYDGLRLAYDSLGRSHAGARAIRPYGYDSELGTVAMEQVRAPLLRDVVHQLPSAFPFAPTAPWSSAGSWLHRFHDLTPRTPVPTVRGNQSEVEDTLREYGAFLHEALGFGRLVDDFVDAACAVARRSLPQNIQTGLAHGDFVAQNAFVHADGAVSVIDGFPGMRLPVYEDLGRMMIGARLFEPSTARPAYGSPSVRPRLHEVALLSGYFGTVQNVPMDSMRVFLGLCTLDKWADSLSKQPRSPARRALRGSRMAVVNHWYRRELAVQLDLLVTNDRYRRTTWL